MVSDSSALDGGVGLSSPLLLELAYEFEFELEFELGGDSRRLLFARSLLVIETGGVDMPQLWRTFDGLGASIAGFRYENLDVGFMVRAAKCGS
jgi:hypothetical protein